MTRKQFETRFAGFRLIGNGKAYRGHQNGNSTKVVIPREAKVDGQHYFEHMDDDTGIVLLVPVGLVD
jgi:hypothetical protein